MGYSKITSVEVTNFMVYSRAKLVFDETNIVNIKGYNSSGKSTMLKAIGVCLTNMYPKSQTKLIRHGEEYFRIVVNFNDGVSILRDKYANGQSLYEMYKDGVCVFTTKEGRKLSKVDDVPEIIKAYLGLCNTSYGCLNYQSRQDKLWLVETTGSENYSTLNEILKSEEISRANALINSDKNALSAEITQIEASVQSVKMERMSAEAYTEELLEALEARERYVQELNRRVRAIRRLSGTISSILEIKVPPVIEKLSYERLGSISDLGRVVTEMKNIRIPPVIPKIEASRLSGVSGLGSLCSQIVSEKAKIISVEIPPISVERSTNLEDVVRCMKAYADAGSSYKELVATTKKMEAGLAKAVAEAEAHGIHFVKCNNCGSYTEVSEGVNK